MDCMNDMFEEELIDMDTILQDQEDDVEILGEEGNLTEGQNGEDDVGRTRPFGLGLERVPKEWNSNSEVKDVEIGLGDRFENASVFRLVMRMYAGEQGFSFAPTRNNKKGLGMVCMENGCPFYIRCSKINNSEQLGIKNFRPTHTCESKEENASVTAVVLAKRYQDYIRDNEKIEVPKFQQIIRTDLKIDVHESKIYRVIKEGRKMCIGSESAQYGMLPTYAEKVMESNPGSKCIVQVDKSVPPRFLRVYLRYAAQRDDFINGCRPFIGLDGCHMKGYYGGQVLSAVARDANNGIFPLAIAVVEQENKESWSWFLEQFFDDFGSHDDYGWVFISDKQKGLVELFNRRWKVEHRHCMGHMFENWYQKFKSEECKKLLWLCASATSPRIFEQHMSQLEIAKKDAYLWLREKPPKTWCKAYYSTISKCGSQTSNICESFNAWILKGRGLPIISFLEYYRQKLMTWFYKKGKQLESHNHHLCPKILEKLNGNIYAASFCTIRRSTKAIYEVTYKDDNYVVDLANQNCSCLDYQLTGIPCAAAAMFECRMVPAENVHIYYYTDTFKKIYGNNIFPVVGLRECMVSPDTNAPTLLPPNIRKPPGRPRKRRIKGWVERGPLGSGSKMTKKESVLTCSICKKKGHNKRTCSTKEYGSNVDVSKPKRVCTGKGTTHGVSAIDDDIAMRVIEKKKEAVLKKRAAAKVYRELKKTEAAICIRHLAHQKK